jgi:hypothetical protein
MPASISPEATAAITAAAASLELRSPITSKDLALAISPFIAMMLTGGVRARMPIVFFLRRSSARLSTPARLLSFCR